MYWLGSAAPEADVDGADASGTLGDVIGESTEQAESTSIAMREKLRVNNATGLEPPARFARVPISFSTRIVRRPGRHDAAKRRARFSPVALRPRLSPGLPFSQPSTTSEGAFLA
jgi:hypothetical protein